MARCYEEPQRDRPESVAEQGRIYATRRVRRLQELCRRELWSCRGQSEITQKAFFENTEPPLAMADACSAVSRIARASSSIVIAPARQMEMGSGFGTGTKISEVRVDAVLMGNFSFLQSGR